MSTEGPAKREGVRVTVSDDVAGVSETQTIWDDYCIVAVGSAEVAEFQVHAKSDGTATHVITVKGVRRG